MLIDGQAFDGATIHYDTYNRLVQCMGNTPCLTTFRPVTFPCHEIMYRFLYALQKFYICCFKTGNFVQFSAGVLNSFEGATLFFALTDNLLLNIIF